MASGSKKVIYAAMGGNLAIAVTKFIAAWFTGSSAMFTEGIHSVVDTGNGALLLMGLGLSNKPPDAACCPWKHEIMCLRFWLPGRN